MSFSAYTGLRQSKVIRPFTCSISLVVLLHHIAPHSIPAEDKKSDGPEQGGVRESKPPIFKFIWLLCGVVALVNLLLPYGQLKTGGNFGTARISPGWSQVVLFFSLL